ncbi:MAG: aminotransferase class I/II-fold pyridoxal phosphate-dependent enzyme [Saprospiraceae bacterium]|nr:aminotransferase class I/II-fold pyridoxal phosphate-dependent enzyme [Saprospiraceae bacterium]
MVKKHKAKKEFETLCAENTGAEILSRPHQLPIYPTAAFCFDSLEEGIEIFANQPGVHVYSRYGNPTVEAVASKIAKLEVMGSDLPSYGLLTSSGMAAIFLGLDSILRTGDIILTQPILYGGTSELFEKIFQKNGIKIINTDLNDNKNVITLLKNNKNIRAIFIETPVNPTLEIVDLLNICKLAKLHKVLTVVDNTFSTPYLTQPLQFGADIVIHSTTKYLHGHGASTGGAVITSNRKLFYEKLWVSYKLLGCIASPFEAWLIDIGLKTLPQRMNVQCQNAFKLAQFFNSHPKIIKVNYPGLNTHSTHRIAKKQMKRFGAMLSIEIKGNLIQVKRILKKLKLCTIAPTLGETSTLILHPASMSHLKTPKHIKEQQGIKDNLVRISVGLENINDLMNDWDYALSQ